MIPKVIHYCWFGEAPYDALVDRCLESWRKQMPEYTIRLWNDENTQFDTPFLKEMLKKKRWAFVSDYVRMRVLAQYGGIYLDTDVEVVKSFDALTGLSCFLGYEEENRINTAVIGAEPGHPYLKACMEFMDQRFAARLPYMTAPEVATKVFLEMGSPSSVTTFPEEYFYPYNPYDKRRSTKVLMFSDVTDNTYAIHHWNKSWQMPFAERVVRVVMKVFGVD